MAPEPDDAPVDLLPPEPTFFRKYSPQLELPISFLISTFLLLTMFGLLVVMMLLAIGGGPEKKVPPISLVDGGDDLEGNGSPGAAGSDGTPSEQVQPMQQQTPDQLPATAVDLPKVREELEKNLVLDDPTLAGVAFNSDNAKNYLQLDDKLREKLKGGTKGPGGAGKSPDGDGPGDGPGGPGKDNTRRRSLRWVLNFEIRSGRNYLDQLQSLGAVVLVPVPPDQKEMFLFRDLANPKPGTVATGDELQSFSQQIQFCDNKPASALQVGQALGLNFTPASFWAIFPKEIEAALTKLEANHRGRRAEDIEQTKFAVSMVGGKYKLVVTEQIARR